MGLYFSSCTPNWCSEISYLTENYKGKRTTFSSFEISSSARIEKLNVCERLKFVTNFNSEDYKKNYFCNFSNNCNLSDKFIQPKTMPRYNFNALKSNMFDQETSQSFYAPVVLINSILLQRTNNNNTYLPLGTVLNVIFKYENWLYVQTAYGEEGYIDCNACISLEIFSTSKNEIKNFNSGKNGKMNILSAIEKLNEIHNFEGKKLHCTEKIFDILYLQLTKIDEQEIIGSQSYKNNLLKTNAIGKSVVLIIRADYVSKAKDTLAVKKGDIVYLIHCWVKGWFWVKNENNTEGFIPAVIAGYWCT